MIIFNMIICDDNFNYFQFLYEWLETCALWWMFYCIIISIFYCFMLLFVSCAESKECCIFFLGYLAVCMYFFYCSLNNFWKICPKTALLKNSWQLTLHIYKNAYQCVFIFIKTWNKSVTVNTYHTLAIFGCKICVLECKIVNEMFYLRLHRKCFSGD